MMQLAKSSLSRASLARRVASGKPLASIGTQHFSSKRDIIGEMKSGRPIIGDGGFVFELEKRGFVQAGPWTPEAMWMMRQRCSHRQQIVAYQLRNSLTTAKRTTS